MTPIVAFGSCSDFCFEDDEFDEFNVIADYVFQVIPIFPSGRVAQDLWRQNSNATSVLTHHQDLVEIRAVGPSANIELQSLTFGQAGGSGDILSLLRTKRPRIVVEESGGQITP